ncbi:MAG: hypothetical protein FWC72_04645, partial [Oscillospiraceae bacterium]|nr:hypothetical protein [Oscillospiraceae bacterium]
MRRITYGPVVGARIARPRAANGRPYGMALRILKIGIPFGIQMGLLNLAGLFVTRLVNPYGVAASAALGAGSRVVSLFVVPMMAIGNA